MWGMDIVTEAAKEAAPVHSGDTRAAIKTKAVRTGRRTLAEVETVVSAQDFPDGYFYPPHVEFGRIDAPSNPFMTPTYEGTGPRVLKAACRAVLAGILNLAKGR